MFIIKTKGFSLVELLIAMVIGLFVAGIVTTMYISVLRANSTTVQLARLNQDLQSALDIMSRDIQRAGYVSGAEAALARDVSGDAVNPAAVTTVQDASFSAFTIVSGALSTTKKDLNPTGSTGNCILIRYDANNDGSISGNRDVNDEVIGYRYNNNAIEFNSWADPASQTCADTLSPEEWRVLAGGDGHINITGLTFRIDPISGASPTYLQRSIIITVSGASTNNTALDISLERRVRLRNDQFIEK